MEWQILKYGMENKTSRFWWRCALAFACISFSQWSAYRLKKRIEKKPIDLPAPRYSAEDIIKKIKQSR